MRMNILILPYNSHNLHSKKCGTVIKENLYFKLGIILLHATLLLLKLWKDSPSLCNSPPPPLLESPSHPDLITTKHLARGNSAAHIIIFIVSAYIDERLKSFVN